MAKQASCAVGSAMERDAVESLLSISQGVGSTTQTSKCLPQPDKNHFKTFHRDALRQAPERKLSTLEQVRFCLCVNYLTIDQSWLVLTSFEIPGFKILQVPSAELTKRSVKQAGQHAITVSLGSSQQKLNVSNENGLQRHSLIDIPFNMIIYHE